MFWTIRLPLAAITLLFTASFTKSKLPAHYKQGYTHTSKVITSAKKLSGIEKYHQWQLDKEGIAADVFVYAMQGYQQLLQDGRLGNSKVLTLVDFSKPSIEKRLYLIDTETGKLLYKSLVAHGKNSGRLVADFFSNQASSYASSLGFYITAGTYQGKHGYSLRLQGCEKGINDQAYSRAIVIHGADYVSESFIQQNGYLGRSHGCPALPADLNNKIINEIKNGSCLFVYAPQKKYLQQSALLNR
ncbi:MAG: hypothetical protein RL172_552 [Bacteroidota bacterium]|jgi:hypothetical protein